MKRQNEASGDTRNDDVIAATALVSNLERHAAERESRAFGQTGEGTAYQIAAVIVDDREAVINRRRETQRDIQGASAKADCASRVYLVVAANTGCGSIQLDVERRAGKV